MRNRVYFNVREKNLSVLDYKTNKVTRKLSQVYLTNAMFVVRKSGNKRVREEGRKNVHAFVNGIIQNRLPNNQELFYHSHKVQINKLKLLHSSKNHNHKLNTQFDLL